MTPAAALADEPVPYRADPVWRAHARAFFRSPAAASASSSWWPWH